MTSRRFWRTSTAGVLCMFLILLCYNVIVVISAQSSTTTTTTTSTNGEGMVSQECVMVGLDGQCQNTDVKSDDPEGSVDAVTGSETKDTASIEEEKEELDPVWLKGRASDIGEFLKCPWNDEDEDDESVESSLSEIHTEETWKIFNQIYHQVVVDQERSSLPPSFQGTGFQVPIEIKYLPSVGRGVFAKSSIKKGQLIWKSINTAEFERAQDYRDFLRKLPQNLACDVLIWAYVRMISKTRSREFKVCADLDEGSFVNHSSNQYKANSELGIDGRLLDDDEDEELIWYGCNLEFYANRDIDAGEEIRVNYDDFVERHGWGKMGL